MAVQDLFKRSYLLEPGKLQIVLATIHSPFIFKIVYGFMSDNVPIFGSKRRSYLIICAVMQVVSMLIMTLFPYSSLILAASCTFLTTLSVAFSDVIIDSLLVI